MTFRKLSLLTLILCCFISCTKSQDETSTTDTQTIKGETAKPKAQEIGSESLSNKNWLKILDNKNSEDLDKWFSKNPNKELLMGNNWKALLKNKNLEKKPDIYNQLALRLSLYYNFSCKFLSFINFNYFKQTNNKLKVDERKKVEELLNAYNYYLLENQSLKLSSKNYPKALKRVQSFLDSKNFNDLNNLDLTVIKKCNNLKECQMVIEKAAQSPIYTYRNQNLKINYYDPYPYCIGAEKILGLVTQENLPPYWYEALPKNLVKNVKIKKEDFKNNNSNYFLTPFKGIDTIQLKNPILGILQLKKKILGEKYLFSLNAHTLLQGNVEKWMQKLEPLHYKESAFKINLLNSPSLFLKLSLVFSRARNFSQAILYIRPLPGVKPIEEMIRRYSVALSFDQHSVPKGD